VVAAITASGGEAIGVVTDVSSFESLENLAKVTIERYGKVNFLHNNAGIVTAGALDELTLNDWQWTWGKSLVQYLRY
tara:strand:- start:181 stop:411 length:231 start_codon:yes stop_codon:yes gene_type:complete